MGARKEAALACEGRCTRYRNKRSADNPYTRKVRSGPLMLHASAAACVRQPLDTWCVGVPANYTDSTACTDLSMDYDDRPSGPPLACKLVVCFIAQLGFFAAVYQTQLKFVLTVEGIVAGSLLLLGGICVVGTAYCNRTDSQSDRHASLLPVSSGNPPVGGVRPGATGGVRGGGVTSPPPVPPALAIAQAQAATAAISHDVPSYWTGKGKYSVMFQKVSKQTKKYLQNMMDISNPSGLNGNDRWGAQHTSLQIVRAWRLENPALWQIYATERTRMLNFSARNLFTPADVRPQLVKAASKLEKDLKLAHGVNETYLLHGTHPHTIMKVAQTGFEPRMAGSNAGTMFGEGVYFAEHAEKIDQYTSEEDPNSSSDPIVQDLHQRLQYDKHGHPARLCYALVARVCLGEQARTQDGKTILPDEDTPLFPVNKRELGELPPPNPHYERYHSLLAELGGLIHRHREYVFFHGQRCYPEYLIAYRRS